MSFTPPLRSLNHAHFICAAVNLHRNSSGLNVNNFGKEKGSSRDAVQHTVELLQTVSEAAFAPRLSEALQSQRPYGRFCVPTLFSFNYFIFTTDINYISQVGYVFMEFKKGFVLREVAGQTMVVATGEASKDFHGMIRLNETGKLVWQGIADGKTAEEIAEDMTGIFSVDRDRALADVTALITKMKAAGILLA